MAIMLFKTNILALVSPDSNINKLIIWDGNRRKDLCEFKFNKTILNVKLWIDKIVVVCDDKIFIFNLYNYQKIDEIETGDNSNGIVAISYEEEQILSYPDKETGFVKIKNLKKQSEFNIKASDSNVAYLSLSYDGRILATASEQGTLIRIFNTENGNLLQEVRRGKNKVEMKYICIEPNLKYMAALSDRGTIHIWSLFKTLKNLEKIGDKDSKENNLIENQTSNLKWLPSYLGGNFFNSEWSFAQIRNINPESIFCFGKDNTIIIISNDGQYCKYKIDLEKGGECKKIEEEEKQFIQKNI
jgi:WD40 repeat protein